MKLTLKKELCGSILDIGGSGEGIIGRLYKSSVTAVDNVQEELDIALPEETVHTEYGIIGTDITQSAKSVVEICLANGLNPLEHAENSGNFYLVLKK